MNLLETPISFIDRKTADGHIAEMIDQCEICQGGPGIGNLVLDGRKVNGYQFGGPFWVTANGIVAPLVERGFFNTGFRLSQVGYDGNIRKFGSVRDIIWIIECDDDLARYCCHLDRTEFYAQRLSSR